MSKTQSLGVVGNEALGGEKGMENDDAGKDGETGDESSGQNDNTIRDDDEINVIIKSHLMILDKIEITKLGDDWTKLVSV